MKCKYSNPKQSWTNSMRQKNECHIGRNKTIAVGAWGDSVCVYACIYAHVGAHILLIYIGGLTDGEF